MHGGAVVASDTAVAPTVGPSPISRIWSDRSIQLLRCAEMHYRPARAHWLKKNRLLVLICLRGSRRGHRSAALLGSVDDLDQSCPNGCGKPRVTAIAPSEASMCNAGHRNPTKGPRICVVRERPGPYGNSRTTISSGITASAIRHPGRRRRDDRADDDRAGAEERRLSRCRNGKSQRSVGGPRQPGWC